MWLSHIECVLLLLLYLAQTVRLYLRCDVVSTCSMIPASSKNKVPLWKRHPKVENSMKFNLSTSIFWSEGSKFDLKTTGSLTIKLVICTQSWSASGNNKRKLLESNNDIQFKNGHSQTTFHGLLGLWGFTNKFPLRKASYVLWHISNFLSKYKMNAEVV